MIFGIMGNISCLNLFGYVDEAPLNFSLNKEKR